jgi:hypothetical protein
VGYSWSEERDFNGIACLDISHSNGDYLIYDTGDNLMYSTGDNLMYSTGDDLIHSTGDDLMYRYKAQGMI